MDGDDRVLAVVAHGDDEVLGCGGTLARAVRLGARVRTLVLTCNDSSRGEQPPVDRTGAIDAAQRELGVQSWKILDWPDNRLDQIDAVKMNDAIAADVQSFRPTHVITHTWADLSSDHRRVCEAVHVACRPQVGSELHSLMTMEVRSATDFAEISGIAPFSANAFVALSQEDAERKLAALRCYAEELRPWPHPRSERALRALMKYRGSQVAVPLAEAFAVSRTVAR